MYGHAADLARLGTCTAEPGCTRPPVVKSDTDPTIRECAAHAAARLTAELVPA